MTDFLSQLAQPIFNILGPERAHKLAIAALKAGIHPQMHGADDPRLGINLLGLAFANPLGIAAGFDKNGEVCDAILNLGFGFSEIGTITPRPQTGNPRPRVFRLDKDHAIINRLGFNNEGHGAVLARLQARANNPGIIGVNIGANKDSGDRIGDYVTGIKNFYDVANYFTINVSSPNTPGLRDLLLGDHLQELIDRILETREAQSAETGRRVPLLLKISPDLTTQEVENIAAIALKCALDGLIIANTTIARGQLGSPQAREQGGLSGPPLFASSTRMLAQVFLLTKGRLPLIGVGGINSADTAYTKIKAGASLIQLYTGLVYQGVGLVTKIKTGLVERLTEDGYQHLTDAIGSQAKQLSE